jgi:hypothetical protein
VNQTVTCDIVAEAEGRERRLRVVLGLPITDLRGRLGEVWFGPRGTMRPVVDVVDLDSGEHVHLDASAHDVVAFELYGMGLVA